LCPNPAVANYSVNCQATDETPARVLEDRNQLSAIDARERAIVDFNNGDSKRMISAAHCETSSLPSNDIPLPCVPNDTETAGS
jgi:hypothetical protein